MWNYICSFFTQPTVKVEVHRFDEPSDSLTLDNYQRVSFTTAMYPEKGTGSINALVYTALGLGESGEVQGKIKKILRDKNGKITPEIKDAIINEVSDCLWYIAAISTELGVPLSKIGEVSLEKVLGRKERGTITGSGDNR